MGLGAIGAALHASVGIAATYQATAADAATVVTVRVQTGTSNPVRTRRAHRDALSAEMHLLVTVVASRPPRGARIAITDTGVLAAPWVGPWLLTADAEPNSSGEWRCAVTRDTTIATIAETGGARRQRIAL